MYKKNDNEMISAVIEEYIFYQNNEFWGSKWGGELS